ncbi:carboxypeptidase-like regulatory domain-containing protein [Bacteroidota bacterium]
MPRFFCIFLVLVFYTILPVHAQENTPDLSSWIEKIAEEKQLRIYYKSDWFSDINVPNNLFQTNSLEELEYTLDQNGFNLIHFDPNYVVIVQKPESGNHIFHTNGQNQDQLADMHFDPNKIYTIKGEITDGKTSEPLIGATIYIKELETGTITNEFGIYSISIPSNAYQITVSAVGFEKHYLRLGLISDTIINFQLFDETTRLQEIIIYEEAEDHNVTDISMGRTRLNISTIKSIPPLMGEVDIIRSITLLPGVTTVGEGATGFNVRGGSVDQNLVLLDDAPVYNTSHFFGFFSSFNSKSVKDVTISKGGIPAQYGGRISSVLDVKVKSGNKKKVSGDGGVGILSANLLVDGPVRSENTTFLLSGRATYSDYYLRFIPNANVQNSSAQFYDLIGKMSHKFNNKNLISATGYFSRDKFGFPGDTTYFWSMGTGTFKWLKTFGPNLNMTTALIYSAYDYEVEGRQSENGFQWHAGIRQYILKGDFRYDLNYRNIIDFGYGLSFYENRLGDLKPNSDISNVNTFTIPTEQGLEPYLYYNHEFRWNSKLTLMGGLRFSGFLALGPKDMNIYKQDGIKNISEIIGIESYSSGEIIEQYAGFEPRLSIRYGLNKNSSLKSSYNRMRQYIHLISNTTAVTPVDIWKLSDFYIPPQIGDQVTFGYFWNFKKNTYEASIEAYFKKVQNSIDYKDGADLILNDHLETELVFGELETYGAELLIKKNKGRLTGWLGYTLSNGTMRTYNKIGEESINFGDPYPVNFDKLHDFSAVGNYQFTRRYSFGFAFVFNSGRPITYPVGSYGYNGMRVANFELRNQERVPAYHRLDISYTVEGNHKRDKKWHGSWTFSVYNLFGRKNAYSIYFKAKGRILPEAYKLAIIGIPVPSITYNFKF